MNLYVRTINNVVDYIEERISEHLTLQSVSQQFYLSEFHFSRLFTMLTGKGFKQYILGRKLAAAAEKLKDPHNTITEIAYGLGFEYPEVFSRDFKKWFGTSPAAYRNGNFEIAPMQKVFVVERDIVNFQGVVALKENYVYLDEQNLYGVFIEVDENSNDINNVLLSTGESFLTDKRYNSCLKDDLFYTVVNCFGDGSGRYSVFYGGELVKNNEECKLKIRNIPAGWYACFNYHGEMTDMRKTFEADFYRWVILKEIELCSNGIGMLNLYDREDMQNVRILVPVKQPK